jgi:hypothetical protein
LMDPESAALFAFGVFGAILAILILIDLVR